MTTYRARYIFPVDRPPIENGAVAIEGEFIRAVGSFPGESEAIDLGDVAIIPGLVNAHTHLEFSDLQQPLGEPGMSLPWWIREVIKRRGNLSEVLTVDSSDASLKPDPFDLGVKESARSGVVTIGEIATSLEFKGSPLNIARFFELRGLRQQQAVHSAQEAASVIARCDGLSPHAPYTVHRNLLDSAISLCGVMRKPLVMHVAESREELQFLQTSRGPFRDLLEERGWWEAGAVALGQRPLDYLQRLSSAPRSVVVHGNYLDGEEIRFLGDYRDRMSVVYCPRTHAYFQLDPYPLGVMLSNRVMVALGTDSRASNPDLDLRQEMRQVIEQHGISPEHALRLGTLNGAIALGMEEECGTLTNGKYGTLAVVQLPSRFATDPHELLFDPEARVVATISRGNVVFSQHPALPP